jgi:hypothetical protein
MSFGLYVFGFLIVIGGADVRRHPFAYASTLDRNGRDRTLGLWDSDGRQIHVSSVDAREVSADKNRILQSPCRGADPLVGLLG